VVQVTSMVATGPRLPKPIGGDSGGDEPLRISLGEGMMGARWQFWIGFLGVQPSLRRRAGSSATAGHGSLRRPQALGVGRLAALPASLDGFLADINIFSAAPHSLPGRVRKARKAAQHRKTVVAIVTKLRRWLAAAGAAASAWATS
jgi:hypothetical protein